jgi:MSHA biogenesis protein MshL
MAIVTGTRYNMLVGPEVTGTITVNLKDVTVRDALESIRELYGYEFNIKGNRIIIQPNAMQTRMFKVNYLAMARSGGSTLTVGAPEPTTLTSQTQMQFSSGTSAQSSTSMKLPDSGRSGRQKGSTSYDGSGSRVSTDYSIDFWTELKRDLEDIVGVNREEVVSNQQTPPISSSTRNTTISKHNADTPVVIVSKVSGTVMIRAWSRDLRLVEEYLASSKFSVERQVMLEAKIIEVRLTEGAQSGINWASFHGNRNRTSFGITQPNTSLLPSGSTSVTDADGNVTSTLNALSSSNATVTPGLVGSVVATALGGGFVGLALQTTNFAALLNFLETQGSVSVLSSPRVASLNNQKAMLKVGTDEVYVSGFTMGSSSSSTGTAITTTSVPSPETSNMFSGISLDVTPQIDEDGSIVLHVHPAISTVREVQKTFNLGTAGIITLPLASREVNETDSIVRAQDGNIVAIGGMMNQYHSSDRSGLPGTINSPFGVLTGERGSKTVKSEMVILIKPTIIHGDQAWVKDIEQSSERMRNMGVPQSAVSTQ